MSATIKRYQNEIFRVSVERNGAVASQVEISTVDPDAVIGGGPLDPADAIATDQFCRRLLVAPQLHAEVRRYLTDIGAGKVDPCEVVEKGDPTGSAYRSRTLASILSDPNILKPPQALVARVVFPSRVTMLAAREKAGKSTFATAIAAAYTRGHTFLGGDATPAGNVLWIGLEELEGDLAQRLTAFGADPARLYIAGPGEICEMADLEREAGRPGFGLIIVDSLSKVAEREGIDDGGNAQKWSLLMSRITQVARTTKAGVVALHHMNKDGGYRDSTSIGAGVDIIVEMDDGPADDPSLRRLRPKGRINVVPFSVRYDAAGPRFSIAGGELTPDARALAHAAANPGLSTNELAAAIGGRRDTSLAVVRAIRARGALVNHGTGSKAALHVAGPSDVSAVPSTRSVPTSVPTPVPGTDPVLVPDQFPVGSAPVPVATARFPTDIGSRPDPLGPRNGNRSPSTNGTGKPFELEEPAEVIE